MNVCLFFLYLQAKINVPTARIKAHQSARIFCVSCPDISDICTVYREYSTLTHVEDISIWSWSYELSWKFS